VSHNTYGRAAPLALALALGTALLLALGGGAARVLVAVPFALILPGLALTFAAFPAGRLDVPERILFTLGLSLAVVTVGGLALHLTPWGLRPASWAALLGAIVCGAGGVAVARWRGVARARAADAAPDAAATTWRPSGVQAVQCALAILVLAGALTLTIWGAQGQSTVGFTQLGIIAGGAPDAPIARLGVTNQEPATTRFRLNFAIDQRLVQTWSLTLEPGERWEEALPLAADVPPTATIEAILYREESPDTIYRRVQIQRGQR